MSDTPQNAEFNTVIDAEDTTANILPEDQRAQPSAAQQDGIDTAKKNAAAERKASTSKPVEALGEDDDNIKDAQESARINAKAEADAQSEQYEIAKNDTSKAGKVRATKAQLNPSGDEKISDAEITRAAVDGKNVKGGSGLSNEEVAERAKNPGKAEEENGKSIAGEGVDEDHTEVSEEVAHANSNENEHTGEGGIAKELAGPQNQSGKTATTQADDQAHKN